MFRDDFGHIHSYKYAQVVNSIVVASMVYHYGVYLGTEWMMCV